MLALHYKGRIHKGKFSARGLRYIAADQIARLVPALQKRWLFPVESVAIGDAAESAVAFPSIALTTQVPDALAKLGLSLRLPVSITHTAFTLRNVTVTGWAGAMIKDGKLLTVRPRHNWVSALRPRPYSVRTLPADAVHVNLMAPMTARGHMFHWLYDALIPFMTAAPAFAAGPVRLLVNAERTSLQNETLAFLARQFPVDGFEPVAEGEAVHVPHLVSVLPLPHIPRALQAEGGMAHVDALAAFLSSSATPDSMPRRIYISRNDARLRRVLNEKDLQPVLDRFGVTPVVLKGKPLAEQVALFRNAEAIVAPHGAGLAHITWCRPGTQVLELFPSPDGPRGRVRNATSDYWIVAQMRCLSYRAMLAGPVANRTDGFEVDPAQLSNLLGEAGFTKV